MIVAATAAERHSKKRPSHRIDLLVDDIHSKLLFVLLFVVDCSEHQVSGSDDLFVVLLIRFEWQKIASKMFTDELIERFVVVNDRMT